MYSLSPSRQGPPIWQPYYDLLKLLGKEDIESGESPAMQRFASWLSLAAILTVAVLVPMGTVAPLAGAADAYLLIYLLTLCGISTMLAGLAAGSTYSLLGMSREMMSLMTLEPLLAVAVVIGVVQVRSLRLDVVLNGSAYAPTGVPLAGILMLGVAILLPITFLVPPASAIIFLAAIYYGAMYGGAISSVTLGIPGAST